ncbi:MAG TPA: N-acetylmuramoyl-L-alanine amidase-like domain-containing protein [Candidatus Kapabacteria bacterium]|nr:N-acetylmuramoyl-L-alanine amidase-like domain-containing protein [Candidatus Kapabacteria bacterium]
MRYYIAILGIFMAAGVALAQPHIDASPATDSSFHTVLQTIKKQHLDALPIGERTAAIGKLFLGKPYIDKSLEVGTDVNDVVCNLQGFDCVTLFENSWALSRLAKVATENKLVDLGIELRKTRYRNGMPVGFQSRLHYTSDYFYQNTKNQLLKEMTGEIGGDYAELETKKIDFMSAHRMSYKQLREDSAMVDSIKVMEARINARGGYYYIRKENVADIESGIQTGDLIGITTSVPGIDCSHTGIAVREKDGRIHFLHASSAAHKVIVTDVPLADYLATNNRQTGIMIYRPLEQPSTISSKP